MTETTTEIIYTGEDLAGRYRDMTGGALVWCTLETEIVGGMSADENGIRAFVEHHLKLSGEEAEKTIKRILAEEVGVRDVPSETGELEERLTYGVNIIRRSEFGPWLGNWMVKACLKAAASRIGLFMSKRGVKGDVAEMGSVRAIGGSYSECGPHGEEAHGNRIHLLAPGGDAPAATYYKVFKGRVQSPQGSVSVAGHRECAPAGSRFGFEFRWYDGKLTRDDVADVFAAAMNIGLGSAKAFERGKFTVDSLEIVMGREKEVKQKQKVQKVENVGAMVSGAVRH